jgi:hypothetical protein
VKHDRLGLQRRPAALVLGVDGAILQAADPAALELAGGGNIGAAFLPDMAATSLARQTAPPLPGVAWRDRLDQADALDVANFSAIVRQFRVLVNSVLLCAPTAAIFRSARAPVCRAYRSRSE